MRVLILSYGYPPRRHVSGQRAWRAGLELARLGHQVSVLTQDWRFPLPPEPSRPEDVVAAWAREKWDCAPKPLCADLRWIAPDYSGEEHPEQTAPIGPLTGSKRLANLARRSYMGTQAQWFQAVMRLAPLLYHQWQPDVIWAISGGDSPHALASRLNRRFGTPWIADFKDPWPMGCRNRIARLIVRCQRTFFVRSAACLTETSELQARQDAQTFQKPAHVVYSGYDDELMARATPKALDGAFNIVYSGTPNSGQDWSLVLDGLHRFLSGSPEARNNLRFVYLGTGSESLKQRFASRGLIDTFVAPGYMSVDQSFSRQKGAHLLLHAPFHNKIRDRYVVSMKFFEYLASGAPVLSVPGETSECSSIGRRVSHYCEAEAPDDVALAIKTHWTAWKSGAPLRGSVNSSFMREYTWGSQVSARLAPLMQRITGTTA